MKRDIALEKPCKTLSHLGIVWYEPSQKISFALQTLQLVQGSRGRKIHDGLDFKRIQADTLSGDDEPEKSARLYAEDTLVRIKPDTVVSTAQKDIAKMGRMVFALR